MADDMMSTLKGLLGDNAEEKIQSVLSALGNSPPSSANENPENTSPTTPAAPPNITPELLQYVGQFKSMIDDMSRANDSRSNLLIALKPYMRKGRQRSIDKAVKLLNISKLTGLFK